MGNLEKQEGNQDVLSKVEELRIFLTSPDFSKHYKLSNASYKIMEDWLNEVEKNSNQWTREKLEVSFAERLERLNNQF